MFFSSWVDALVPGAVHLLLLLVIAAVAVSLRRPAWPRGVRVGLLVVLAWTWVFSTPAIANRWVRHLEGDALAIPLPQARDDHTLVVVLASGETSYRGGPLAARLDEPGLARLSAGVALWRQTGGRLAVVGGARSATGSMARTMATLAQAWGVPADAIEVVDGSTRTHEDLTQVQPLVQAHGGPLWLVTSALHMPRALVTAEHLGLRMQPLRCDYRQYTRLGWVAWLPNAGAPAAFAEALHETLGLLYYRWRGWA